MAESEATEIWNAFDRLDRDWRALKARAQAAEANLARAREIMKPFADKYDKSEAEFPDTHLDHEKVGGVQRKHFRAASRFLTEGGSTAPSDGGGKG